MSQFPINTEEGLYDAVNYLASGPSGLGQNFEGFSAYLPAYVRPKGKQPWSLPITTTLNPSVYLNIPISNITIVGGNPSRLVTFTFTTPQATAPFQYGDGLEVYDVVSTGGDDPYNYDGGYTVYECTTTDVTIVTSVPINWNTYVSGGWVGRDFMNFFFATDCNARVSVQSATTQVFVSAQINAEWNYYGNISAGSFYDVIVRISRLRGFPSDTAGSNEYLFGDSVVVSEKTFGKPLFFSNAVSNLEAIFTTILDAPEFGYYWYILELEFVTGGGLGTGNDNQNTILSGTKATSGSIVTYSAITPTTVTGSGSGASLDITLQASASGDYVYYDSTVPEGNTTIDIVSSGKSYRVGDTLKILGTALGGASPANDLLLTVKSINTGSPYDMTVGKVTTGLRSLTAQVIKQ